MSSQCLIEFDFLNLETEAHLHSTSVIFNYYRIVYAISLWIEAEYLVATSTLSSIHYLLVWYAWKLLFMRKNGTQNGVQLLTWKNDSNNKLSACSVVFSSQRFLLIWTMCMAYHINTVSAMLTTRFNTPKSMASALYVADI